MKRRIFTFSQYEFNPTTGEDLHFNEENIKSCMAHKSIKQFAYIKHDKDLCTKEDEVNGHKIGDKKPDHWQGAMRCDRAVELETIAKWLGIPPQYIEVPGGGNRAFLDCVKYLTHEDEKQQELGKHLYDDSEVIANFDFREELNKREERILKYGRELSKSEQLIYDVTFSGKTIKQVMHEDEIFYMNNIKKIQLARGTYLSNCPPPTTRTNFYICGNGGAGKDLLSRAIARSLFPQYEDDDDIFFTIGAENVTFEGYDGQPVIIWSDCRAIDLISRLGNRGNVFNVFDTHPLKIKQNIKNNHTSLINVVNIVNSVQPYLEFLNGLAGEYTDKKGNHYTAEDKNQSNRRFPVLIPIHEDDFSILINKGFLEDDGDFSQYIEHKKIIGNIRKIHQLCVAREELARQYDAQLVGPIVDTHKMIYEKEKLSDISEDEIKEMFKNYGKFQLDLTRYDLLPF
jgi:hypothetical protein